MQEAALRSLPDIVVATPGRMIDHLRNSMSVHLDELAVLILDEADRLLELGFSAEIHELVSSNISLSLSLYSVGEKHALYNAVVFRVLSIRETYSANMVSWIKIIIVPIEGNFCRKNSLIFECGQWSNC